MRDDLLDAFQIPANPDWSQGRNSLLSLLPRIDALPASEEAQQILIDCGAVSFCAYHIVKRYRDAMRCFSRIPLRDTTPMKDLLARQIRSVADLLQRSGVEVPLERLTESLA